MKSIVAFPINKLITRSSAEKIARQISPSILRSRNQWRAAFVIRGIDCRTGFEEEVYDWHMPTGGFKKWN